MLKEFCKRMTPAGLYIGACKGLVVCKGPVLDCISLLSSATPSLTQNSTHTLIGYPTSPGFSQAQMPQCR